MCSSNWMRMHLRFVVIFLIVDIAAQANRNDQSKNLNGHNAGYYENNVPQIIVDSLHQFVRATLEIEVQQNIKWNSWMRIIIINTIDVCWICAVQKLLLTLLYSSADSGTRVTPTSIARALLQAISVTFGLQHDAGMLNIRLGLVTCTFKPGAFALNLDDDQSLGPLAPQQPNYNRKKNKIDNYYNDPWIHRSMEFRW